MFCPRTELQPQLLTRFTTESEYFWFLQDLRLTELCETCVFQDPICNLFFLDFARNDNSFTVLIAPNFMASFSLPYKGPTIGCQTLLYASFIPGHSCALFNAQIQVLI